MTPYNGYTTLDNWHHGDRSVFTTEIGSVATFHCNVPGYEPRPVASAMCVKSSGGRVVWDFDGVVTCVGRFVTISFQIITLWLDLEWL